MDQEPLKKLSVFQLSNFMQKKSIQLLEPQIEFQGKDAVVRSIGAGRVLLDFNPPLAGKTLIYDVTVTKKFDSKEEKIGALIHHRIPIVEENKFKIAIQDTSLTIDMPEDAFYIEHIEIYKRGIATDIQKFIPDLIETKFVETFKAEPKPVTLPPAPTASSETPTIAP